MLNSSCNSSVQSRADHDTGLVLEERAPRFQSQLTANPCLNLFWSWWNKNIVSSHEVLLRFEAPNELLQGYSEVILLPDINPPTSSTHFCPLCHRLFFTITIIILQTKFLMDLLNSPVHKPSLIPSENEFGQQKGTAHSTYHGRGFHKAQRGK